MELDGIKPVLLRSFLVTVIISVIAGAGLGWFYAKGLLFGGVWSAANLWAIKFLAIEYFKIDKERKNIVRLLIAFHVKVVLLYGIGAFFLMTVPMSVMAGVCGFHIPFLLFLIEAFRYQKKEQNTVNQ